MANPSQQGPLTAEQLQAIWEGGVDSTYSRPYIAAGDGAGLEVHSQAFAQYARVSLAVDRTFQSMFVLPWSGQTNPPASNGQQATVALTIARTGRLGDPLVLTAGEVWVDEQALDAGPSGPVTASTGRRYLLQETVFFFPGEQGPFTASAQAEKPGFSYNDPAPDTIDLVEQPGAGRNNVLATVALTLAALPPATPLPAQQVLLTGDDEPDMFTPDQLGQYVAFTAGANIGLSGLVVGYVPPTPTAGSTVQLGQVVSMLVNGGGSPPVVGGSPLVFYSGATPMGSGVVIAARDTMGGFGLAVLLLSGGEPQVGYSFQQPLAPSGTATGTVTFVHAGGQYTAEAPSGSPETGGASWRMLSWSADWGLTVTNPAQPSGGAIDMLGMLGAEKNLPQLPGETAQAYALRITRVADVVSPNALKRCLVRNVGATGWCFREVGTPLLPGMFFDRTDDGGDACDTASLVFEGSYPGPGLLPNEPCEYVQGYASGGVNVLAVGYWGNYGTPGLVTNPSGYAPATYLQPNLQPSGSAGFTLVLSQDRFAYPLPQIAVQASDRIVGTISGNVFAPTSQVATPFSDSQHWHCALSYEYMRACFLVGVPPLDLGDFGCMYDALAPYGEVANFYDLVGTPWLSFYDGFPVGNAAYYQKLYSDVERTRAGGVVWEMYETNGQTCT